MRLNDPSHDSPRRRFCPIPERLESRELLAVPSQAPQLQVNPSLIPGLVQELYGPITTAQSVTIQGITYPAGSTFSVPQPTPSEIQRQQFVAKFTGKYFVGAPRFSNQASTIHIFSNGLTTTSNQYLKGRTHIILFPPAQPRATPTVNDPVAGQTEGLAVLFTSNYLQSSDALFLDVRTPFGVAANDPSISRNGLPTHLDFTVDTIGSGLYTTETYSTTPAAQTVPGTLNPVALQGAAGGSVAYNAGGGVVDLQYFPAKHRMAGTISSGQVVVTIQGLINFSGVFNPLSKNIN